MPPVAGHRAPRITWSDAWRPASGRGRGFECSCVLLGSALFRAERDVGSVGCDCLPALEAKGVVIDVDVGPRLAEQRDELSRLLKRAATPVEVELVSDNLTSVSIYKVGTLGTFATRRLELRPGTYVAVGARPGYRDVRLEFRVAPEIDMQPVVVRCEETI